MGPYCTRFYCYLRTRDQIIEKPQFSSTIKAILFDMDGVLVDSISSWRHVHTHFSTNNDDSVDAYVRGKISDEEFIRRDVSQWKKNGKLIYKKELETIFSSVNLMKGARSLIESLNQYDVHIGIVSAGIDVLANKVGNLLAMDFVYANQLETESSGRLTGEGIVNVPLMRKDVVVDRIAQRFGLVKGDIAAIGNSCFDIPLLRSVGLGIAFHPDDDCISKEADIVVSEKNLENVTSVLIPYLNKK
jgi:phosphoserine phosphatase